MSKIKSTYQTPQISEVRLDNEISLVLYSLPPLGPEEGKAPEYFEPNKALLT